MIKQRILSLFNAFKNSNARMTGASDIPKTHYTEEYLDELFVSIIQDIGVKTDVFLIHGGAAMHAQAVMNGRIE